MAINCNKTTVTASLTHFNDVSIFYATSRYLRNPIYNILLSSQFLDTNYRGCTKPFWKTLHKMIFIEQKSIKGELWSE